MACVSIAVLGVRLAAAPVNGDVFFHLRLGHEFLTGWSPRDPGSVTVHATSSWLPTQWLSEIALARMESAFGLQGIQWTNAAMGTALAGCMFVTARRHAGPQVATVVFLVALLAAAPSISARPQVVSLLVVTVLTSGWLRAHSLRTLPWWIVPMTWVWALVHGMWISGVLISTVAACALVLRRCEPRLCLAAFSVPLLSLVAAGLTPLGPGIYGAVLRVGSISKYFAEWQSPTLTDGPTVCAGLLLVAVLIHALRMPAPADWTWLLLVALAGAWLVYSERSVSIAAVMLVPLAAEQFAGILPRTAPTRREHATIALSVLATLAVAASVASNASPDERSSSPAHRSVQSLAPGTTLLNDWELGGYDMWRHPDLAIVQHGYGDMFTDHELHRNLSMVQLEPGWLKTVEDVGAQHALLRADSRLAAALEHEGWIAMARDSATGASGIPAQNPLMVHLAAPKP